MLLIGMPGGRLMDEELLFTEEGLTLTDANSNANVKSSSNVGKDEEDTRKRRNHAPKEKGSRNTILG